MKFRLLPFSLACLICTGLYAVPPEGVLNGWDFRKIKSKEINLCCNPADPAESHISIATGKGQKITPVQFASIRCSNETRVKLRIQVSGIGTLSMGCHAYNKSNRWIAKESAEPVSFQTNTPKWLEFNIQLPKETKEEIRGIRPFIVISENSRFLLRNFEIAFRLPEPESLVTGGTFPQGFDRLRSGTGDFPLRMLPSINKMALDQIDLPFLSCANQIATLHLSLISEKDSSKVIDVIIPFEDGQIKSKTIDLPESLTGDFRVEGEYMTSHGDVLCRGRGYTSVMLKDLSSGRYVVGGMLRNAHLKNFVKPYKMGQTVFHFGSYPFQAMDEPQSEKPLPGFSLPKRQGDRVEVRGRKYDLGTNGLPCQIEVQQMEPTVGKESEEILAAPISLCLDGVPVNGKSRNRYIESANAVEIQADLEHNIQLNSRIEQDGVIRLDVKLAPQTTQKIGTLTLRIPLKEEQAYLYHELTDIAYRRLDRTKTGLDAGIGGHAGKTPEKKISGNVVWRSLDGERKMPGSFQPMVWLGTEDRGFCFFADSDCGWLVDENQSCVDIEREDGKVILNIHMINRLPKDCPRQASWRIGLVATPVKEISPKQRGTIFPRWATLDKEFYKKLTNLRKILQVGAGDPRFTSGTCSILPKNPQETQKMYEEMRDEHGSCYMEYWCSDYLNSSVPEMAMYFGEWCGSIAGSKLPPSSSWFKPSSRFSFSEATWLACRRIVPSYLKYRLWCLDQKLRTVGQISFYEDNIHMRRFCDPIMGYGAKLPNGKEQIQVDLWSLRNYYRNIAEIFRENGLENLSGAHASAATSIPALAYCTYFIDGEQPARYARGPQRDYVDMWKDTDYFRASILGRQYGVRTIFMSEIAYVGKSDEENEQQSRAWLAVMLPHDVALWDGHIKNRAPVKAWHKIINDLNFLAQPPRLYPYWGKGPFQAAKPASSDLLVTAYRQGQRALLVLSNFGEAQKFSVPICTKNLKIQPSTAVDLEHDAEKIEWSADTLTLDIPRHDYRLILLQ